VVTPFAGGFSSADGITITPDGARMFIADSVTHTVRQVTIPGAVVTTFGPADINNGFAVGGIVAASGNTLIVMTGQGPLTLIAFTY
jgi:sugar lactone lactonase YvrE